MIPILFASQFGEISLHLWIEGKTRDSLIHIFTLRELLQMILTIIVLWSAFYGGCSSVHLFLIDIQLR